MKEQFSLVRAVMLLTLFQGLQIRGGASFQARSSSVVNSPVEIIVGILDVSGTQRPRVKVA